MSFIEATSKEYDSIYNNLRDLMLRLSSLDKFNFYIKKNESIDLELFSKIGFFLSEIEENVSDEINSNKNALELIRKEEILLNEEIKKKDVFFSQRLEFLISDFFLQLSKKKNEIFETSTVICNVDILAFFGFYITHTYSYALITSSGKILLPATASASIRLDRAGFSSVFGGFKSNSFTEADNSDANIEIYKDVNIVLGERESIIFGNIADYYSQKLLVLLDDFRSNILSDDILKKFSDILNEIEVTAQKEVNKKGFFYVLRRFVNSNINEANILSDVNVVKINEYFEGIAGSNGDKVEKINKLIKVIFSEVTCGLKLTYESAEKELINLLDVAKYFIISDIKDLRMVIEEEYKEKTMTLEQTRTSSLQSISYFESALIDIRQLQIAAQH
jgi:hypothetical protein